MANYKALNTIRVLTFNVFENGFRKDGTRGHSILA